MRCLCLTKQHTILHHLSSVTGGEGWSGHTSPLRAKGTYVTGGAGPSQTQWIDQFLSERPGSAGRPILATSSDGGGIAADPPAARPVQVICACVLAVLPVPSGLFPLGHAPKGSAL
jgi:hypothetical protein